MSQEKEKNMKSNWKLTSLVISTAALMTGCQPPVDRNAEMPDTQESAAASEAISSESESAVSETSAPSRLSDASMEIIPEAMKVFTEFPKEKTSAALKAYLDSIGGPEFQAVYLSLSQAQDESSRLGLMAAQKVINDNRKLAADLILGSEDATEEEYRAALFVKLDGMSSSNASIDGKELEFKAVHDQIASGKFPKMAELVNCQLKSVKLMDKVNSLYSGGNPKAEDIESFYAEYASQVEEVLKADMLSDFQLQMILSLTQLYQEQPARVLTIFEKLHAAIKDKPEEKWKGLCSMLEPQIQSLKKDVEIQETKPEQVDEFLAPYRNLPEEKTSANYAEYLKNFTSEKFQETAQALLAVRNEEVNKKVLSVMDEIQTNAGTAADTLLKAEDASEEQFKTALNMKFHLAMAYSNPEEKPTLAQLKEKYAALKDEIGKSKFPKFADTVECYVQAVSILEKTEKFFLGEVQPTSEDLNSIYPDLKELAESTAKADALEGLPLEVLMQSSSLLRADKEKVKELFNLLIQGLEGKTDENSKMFLSSLKMQVAMLDNPQMAQQMSQTQDSQAAQSAPAKPELTAEQVEELKAKLEAYAKLPEEKTASALETYVKSIDSPEFQEIVSPLFQKSEEELQKWLTETMNRVNESLKEALKLICLSQDATEDQFKEALQFRLDVMRADKVRKNIEPDYAALTEEVKSSRFPKLVSLVDLDASSAGLMNEANALFASGDEPTPEQKNELFAKFSEYLDKVLAADALNGPQLQVTMQVSSIFADDDSKMKPFCEKMVKGLEGKDDPQSKQLTEMFQKRLDEIEFLSKPMEFTAPEGTELDELKKMVTQKMEIIMRSMRGGIPTEKLAEFRTAVEKFGNEKLTAYTAWQIDLIHLIPMLSGPEFKLDEFKTKYLECVKTGAEKELFNINCLQMCIQMAAVASQRPGMMDSPENKAQLQEMFETLLPVCDKVAAPETEQFRQSIQAMIEEMKKPIEISPEDSGLTSPLSPPPAAEGASAEALPETIQLEEGAAESTSPSEPVKAEESAPSAEVPAEAKKADEVSTPSESTSTTEDNKEERSEGEENQESSASSVSVPAEVVIPAPILKLISPPENATTEQLAGFLGALSEEALEELGMQIRQSQDMELLPAVLKKLMTNQALAAEKIFVAEDASKEMFTLALSTKIQSLLLNAQGGNSAMADFLKSLRELREAVIKSRFPEMVKTVDLTISAAEFNQSAKSLEAAAILEQAKVLIPQIIKDSSQQEAAVGVLLNVTESFAQDQVKLLEFYELCRKEMVKDTTGKWSDMLPVMETNIGQLKIILYPVEFNAADGASDDELKKLIDEKILQITGIALGDDLEKKMGELKSAVKKLENKELDAYVEWCVELNAFFQKILEKMGDEDFDQNTVLADLNRLANEAEKIKVTETSFMSLLQISASILNFVEAEQEVKIAYAKKIQELAGQYESEQMKQILPRIEQWVASLETVVEEPAEEMAEETEDSAAETEEDDEDIFEDESSSEEAAMPDIDIDAMKAELDAATKPYLELPEDPTVEKMEAFIDSFQGPQFETLITAMQHFPDPEYAQAAFEKMVQNLGSAVDFILESKDATPEQLKLALSRKLNGLASEEELLAVKKKIEERNVPELTRIIDCYVQALQLRDFARGKVETGDVSMETSEEIMKKSRELLQAALDAKCLDGGPLRVLFMMSEVLPAPEQKLEILKALKDSMEAQGTDDGKQLAEILEKRIQEIEEAQKPAEFKVPEGSPTTDELKAAAHAQIQKILEREEADASSKLAEFLESVKKVGNAELTASVEWEVELFTFFMGLSTAQQRPEPQELVVKMTEFIEKGTSTKSFQSDTLQFLGQIGLSMANSVDGESGSKLLKALKKALETSQEEWVNGLLIAIDGMVTQLELPGKPLELEAEDLEGKPVKIQDFAGKTVLVDVWATWCGPCVGEIPNIRRAYDAYHEAGFEVIGLSIDDDLDELKNFIGENPVPWKIVTQKNMKDITEFSEKYGITGIPAMFLVGADGKVITVKARGQLMELLAEIYPDVKVENVPETIDLEAELDSLNEELKSDEAEESVPSESMSAAESISTAQSMSAVEEGTIVFKAEAGASFDELKTQAFNQMMEAIGKNSSQPEETIQAFLKSVEDFGNSELTAAVKWNVSFLNFFRSNSQEMSASDVAVRLASLIRDGLKANAFTSETLMAACQTSMRLLGALDVDAASNLVNAVQEALNGSQEPWVPQFKAMLKGKMVQLQLPGKELKLEAKTLDGQPVKIQDLLGKTVLVDVWATWCGPCVGEIPNMRKAYEVFHDAGFEIIGLSVDRDLDRLKAFQDKENLPWIIATQNGMESETESFSSMYGITGIPAMFLVGADGKVITTHARGRLMELLSKIYPEAAARAEAKEKQIMKELEDALKLDEPPVESQSMSATVESTPEDSELEAASTILDTYSKLPADTSLDSLREFIQSYDRSSYEIQGMLQEMDEKTALEKFGKVMETRSQAADLLIKDANASKEDLKLAVDVKTNVIFFQTQQTQDVKAAEAAFEKLVKELESKNALEAVVQVQTAQLLGASQFVSQMPGEAEMAIVLEKIVEISETAKKAKCMNGDMMGRFMQMIVFANDVGVSPEKIEQACSALRDAVMATEDPQLINTADFISGMARRAMLKGKTMELVGTTLDGKEIDIQKDYAGKVVLVDFWATWCNPCVMELTNLERQYYAKYHDKGFEILGFSIDMDRNQLESFLERRKLPWQTILQKDNAKGCEEPVYYYGIQAIPCLILVGPDGKVIREIPTMRRDEVLTEELKKIYGE